MHHRIFVYGTLKRGFPNHAVMSGARFLTVAETRLPYPMIVQGRHFTPVMIPEPGSGYRIKGEIWEVDDALLARLDELESTHLPHGYVREQIELTAAATKAAEAGFEPQLVSSAWVYFKPRSRVVTVHSEPHADYQDRRYIKASDRS